MHDGEEARNGTASVACLIRTLWDFYGPCTTHGWREKRGLENEEV